MTALAAALGGLATAPAALAAPAPLPTPVLYPSTVAPGQPFALTLSGCFPDDTPGAGPYIYYSSNDPDGLGVSSGGLALPDGTMTFSDLTPLNAVLGTHTITAVCDRYTSNQSYPLITMTVTADGKPAAPVAFVPGATPNTPGIAPTTSSGTGNVAAPGQAITTVLRGFQPHEVVTLVLHSAPVTLGTYTADANGVVTATFTLPAGTVLGTHTLAFDGTAGSHYEVTLTLTADGTALAYTGADIALPLVGGTVLLGAGAGALAISRRRRLAGAVQA
jgi:hypothetical protein